MRFKLVGFELFLVFSQNVKMFIDHINATDEVGVAKDSKYLSILLKNSFIILTFQCFCSLQYFGSLLVIFCVELASGVWTYEEVSNAMTMGTLTSHLPRLPLSHFSLSHIFP